ncbi:MAG: hypothetical protein HOJ31_10115 [Anaerolineae bacterium]|jgi:hypothetical protein|nr:hypothetical protein [Anaerolineae bacterium]
MNKDAEILKEEIKRLKELQADLEVEYKDTHELTTLLRTYKVRYALSIMTGLDDEKRCDDCKDR